MLELDQVLSKVPDSNLVEEYKNQSADGEVHVFILPGGNLAVPLLGIDKDQYMTDFVHIRDLKCNLARCVKQLKSKQHTLVVKNRPVCRHTLLGHLLNHKSKETARNPTNHYINYELTVRHVIKEISEKFPRTMEECRKSVYVANSRTFVNSLLQMPGKLDQILKTIPDTCTRCTEPLGEWKHKPPKSYFISMGHLKEITIRLKVCPKCRIAYYPSFYENGIFFIHNKFLITIEAILDFGQLLNIGGGFIEAVKEKLLLMGQLEGVDMKKLERNLNNQALDIEKIVIATLSIILKGSDLDSVMCLVCGNCPKVACTDGNTKVFPTIWKQKTEEKFQFFSISIFKILEIAVLPSLFTTVWLLWI